MALGQSATPTGDDVPRISFLIPAYNEQDGIIQTIQRLEALMTTQANPYEIIVINDGSRDDTAALARSTGLVKVIDHPANRGYGRALKSGLYSADYEWCAIVDGDGSYPIESFPDLFQKIPAFDMVVGARTGKNYWGSFGKRFGRLILLQLVAFVIGQKIPDANSGMRVFRRDIALEHVRRISSGFSFTVTITLAMFLEEHLVTYVPISYHDRVGNSKVKIGIDSLRVVQILAQAILYYNPLKLFLVLCFLSGGLGLLGGLIALIGGAGWGGALFAGLGLLGALILGGMGFLAEAIRLHRVGATVIPTSERESNLWR